MDIRQENVNGDLTRFERSRQDFAAGVDQLTMKRFGRNTEVGGSRHPDGRRQSPVISPTEDRRLETDDRVSFGVEGAIG
jgi:hypothetical protein